MFGYVMCNKAELNKEEIQRYQSVYCGLCKTLQKRYGQLARISLNYEMTFLIIFLSSLYEPEETEKAFKCPLHPIKTKYAATDKYTDYAADMTILLTYYKCLDDWKDEQKHIQRHYAAYLKENYKEICRKYPRQCKAIEAGIAELNKIEKTPGVIADEAVNCFGRVLSELFVYEEDFWSNSLRALGYDLGRSSI